MPDNDKDPKAKFREALDKKKNANAPKKNESRGGSKVTGHQSAGNTPKMFRRKSGSA